MNFEVETTRQFVRTQRCIAERSEYAEFVGNGAGRKPELRLPDVPNQTIVIGWRQRARHRIPSPSDRERMIGWLRRLASTGWIREAQGGAGSAPQQLVYMQFGRDGVAEGPLAFAHAPDLIAAAAEQTRLSGDNFVPPIKSPVRAFHDDHGSCLGCVTLSTRRRRTVPARSGHSIVAPVRRPIRAAPIGVITEMRLWPESASPG